MTDNKEFPENMIPLGDSPFSFQCHPGVSCFTVCCRQVDLTLYPYDIIRLKNALKISSEEFMRRYTRLVRADNPFFPAVMLSLTKDDTGDCPFLDSSGCTVYHDRPTSCRTYPLERAVDRRPQRGRPREHYFLTHHEYCKGHYEENQITVKQWLRNQRLEDYNIYNDLWTEMDSLFSTNPWQGEGAGGPKQQMAFMVCYNIDGFRSFCDEQRLLQQFRLPKEQRRRIERSDEELLKFGFEWLQLILTGKTSLIRK